VVLAVPVTPRTERLMDATRLGYLKPEAYLVNVGRGVLIDEAALIQALQNRSFASAALDVTTQEPLPADSPLWSMDNVIITPHIAGITDKMWERHFDSFAQNLKRFRNGEPLLWEVEKGY
jgi:phosphoglycerate dehydrogenase-like enzyme